MISSPWKLTGLVLPLVLASGWWLHELQKNDASEQSVVAQAPDAYMENFITVVTYPDGSIKRQLKAKHMSYYADIDHNKLTQPVMQIFRRNKLPLTVSADTALVTDRQTIITLVGNVEVHEVPARQNGMNNLAVYTDTAQYFPDTDDVVTDAPVTIMKHRITSRGIGLQGNLNDGKITLLHHVKSTIQPKSS